MNDEILSAAKLALRISTDDTDFDGEITDLINASVLDMGIAGIVNTDTSDPLIKRAVLTYVKMNFGQVETDVFNRLKISYDEQKAQLSMAPNYNGDNDLIGGDLNG